MIDRRENPVINYGIEENLQKLSDTEIMMNFLEIIGKKYPNLIRVDAHCYDPWDSIAEPLYFTTVFKTFSWKYGIKLEVKNCQVYESDVSTVNDKNHIECRPKKYPLICESFQGRRELSKEFLCNKKIVFVCFSDGVNATTGSISPEEASKMKFAKADVIIISDNGDKVMREYKCCFIDVQDIDFEFVAV